ncbi:hypothetical protein QC761_400530 [Podospora bellae-mahoneyi]|uniref:Uncharacterized protein n=1 Tax=Podospora bellae-mahoneyi TaxID=2093777 RepID=A0ABR0FGD9_9PEZI|nr:hypothetical protein QC761_400530 [Podospora bellae-mahoneyi]
MDSQGTNIFRKFGTKKKRDSMPLPTKRIILPKRTETRETAHTVAQADAGSPLPASTSLDLDRAIPPLHDPPSSQSQPQPQPPTAELTLSEPWVSSHHHHHHRRAHSTSTRNGTPTPSPWEEAEMNRLKASHEEQIRDLKMKLGMELEDTRRDMARRTHQLVELTRLHDRDKEAVERVKELEKEGEKVREELNILKNNAKQNFQIAEEWKKAHDDLTREKERLAEELKEGRGQLESSEKQVAKLEGERGKLTRLLQDAEVDFQRMVEEGEVKFAKEREVHRSETDSQLRTLLEKMEDGKRRLKAEYEVEKSAMTQQMQGLKAEQKHQARRYEEQIQRLKDESTVRLQELRRHYQIELESQAAKYKTEISHRMEESDAKMAAYMMDRDEQAAREREQYERQIADLKQVLMERPGDFDLRLVSDRSLKEEYRALKRSVDTITFNLGPMTIDRNIDAASFLEREGKGQERLFVKALIWAMILDGFFSAPYGFGALGPGGNGGPLFELYRSWKEIVEGDGSKDENGPLGQNEFGPLYRDRYANSWRSTTFQSILYAAAAKDADGNSLATGVSKTVQVNRQRVQDNMLAMLKSVCRGDVSKEIQEELTVAVGRASELAIVFGAHRANVCFSTPNRGDAVELGREFIDCQDSDGSKGVTVTVELPVLPALFIIGDGKNDLTSVLCVEQGEVLPVAGSC